MPDGSELAGRVIAVGIDGPALDAGTRAALERLRPGTVVLFGRNVVDPQQLRALVGDLHRLRSRPLVAIDHEGGRVSRLSPPFTTFPGAADIGAAGVDAARAVGEAIGRELAGVGIDIDFAPVLDVAGPTHSALGDRCFAADPDRVAALGIAFARGLAAGGVMPCGKHFPGHGATAVDSHHARPIVSRSRRDLDARDLVPFRAAVAAGLPMLMTAHIVYPALDPDAVATVSPAIVGHLLRRRMRFGGVLWSDDLAMAAIGSERSPAEAAVEALVAGVDGVLVCHDLDEAHRTAERVLRAADGGRLAAGRLRRAAGRLTALAAWRRAPGPLSLPIDAHRELADRVRAVAAASRAC